jgi:hypothetical protein
MEYIHLKDMRAASMEPVNVLSSYKWQDGLGYMKVREMLPQIFFISYYQSTYVLSILLTSHIPAIIQ